MPLVCLSIVLYMMEMFWAKDLLCFSCISLAAQEHCWDDSIKMLLFVGTSVILVLCYLNLENLHEFS